jgi:hypothetical protein
MDNTKLFHNDRELLLGYLKEQLLGPSEGENEGFYKDSANNLPYQRYVMGTLYPQVISDDEYINEEINTQEMVSASSDSEEVDDTPMSMVFQRLPASIGMSFYVKDCKQIEIDVWGAQYKKINQDFIDSQESLADDKRILKKRLENYPEFIRIPLATEKKPEIIYANKTQTINALKDKAEIKVVWRPLGKGSLITVTMLNPLKQEETDTTDPELCLYQVGFKCRPSSGAFDEYFSLNRLSYDDEESELALQYKKNINYGVGHGCSVNWPDNDSTPNFIETTFMPTQEVKPQDFDGAEDYKNLDVLSLQFLGKEGVDSKILNSQLEQFITSYEKWYEKICDEEIDKKFKVAKERISSRIGIAIDRIRLGISILNNNEQARQAFVMANQVMLRQMVHVKLTEEESINPYKQPDYKEFKTFAWRPFQLAFQLLIIESLVNEDSKDRDTLDLIWFPTGGGKTEAYLGVAAFELIYRRLKFGEAGAGTAVITRYTLRLLTSQQFERSATFICVLEMMRKNEKLKLLGKDSFSLGYWAGQTMTPNKYIEAYEKYGDMRGEENPKNPFVLQKCPLCATQITPHKRSEESSDYGVKVTETSFNFNCPSNTCDLHKNIPISVVDEDLYENPPSFLIGTIDKFARLAWDNRASNIFCPDKNRAPSLIIQDELHLISGQLGTIAGLYEAAIDVIISSKGVRPKYIAATATIRRSADQVKKLYGNTVDIFPPAGLSWDDSYFSKTSKTANGRLYVGIMAQGQSPVLSLVNTAAALSQSVMDCKGLSETAINSWWTQVIYHSSKRELGKTISLASDDIPMRIDAISRTKESRRQLTNIQEMSSVIKTELPTILSDLKKNQGDKGAIDILPCTNMISVGVDVSRLGLMLIYRQPKLTSEYIQASSRVGRSEKYAPGIVVTLYSANAPRDRSHYESFKSYHRSLYRYVEPTSVTPFSPRARDRALHAALVIVMRHAGGLSENNAAKDFNPKDKKIEKLIGCLLKRMVRSEPSEEIGIEKDLNRLITEWVNMTKSKKPLRYEGKSKSFKSLLVRFNSKEAIEKEGWPTQDSMRNVDAEALIEVLGE